MENNLKRILVIDDDPEIRQLLKDYLAKENFRVTTTGSGKEALEVVADKTSYYHLIVLDIMLPDISGIELCKKFRKISNIPIIMLTARSDDTDKIVGLEVGADDYLTKPFNLKELVARIKAILRRSQLENSSKTIYPSAYNIEATSNKDNIIQVSFRCDNIKNTKIVKSPDKNLVTLKINLDSRRVFANSEEIKLTNKEYHLLLYLIRNKNIVLSRDKLLENIWGYDFVGESRTVDVHIKQLRKKIGDSYGNLIETVWSVGYRLNY